jgi:iron complex outermembrane receptor protein
MTKIPNTPSVQSLDIKASYTLRFKMLKTELSTGINNAGNTKYAASILPNVGFGNKQASDTRKPRNYYGGVSLSYLLNSR